MKTEQKKKVMGMLTIGADMFRNQLGVMGKNLRKSRKKNKQSWFSSTWEGKGEMLNRMLQPLKGRQVQEVHVVSEE